MLFRTLALCFLLSSLAPAQHFYTYVGDIGIDRVLLAWGTTEGDNTIGRSSPSHGQATVKLNGREFVVIDRNWVTCDGLKPDSEYPYEVLLEGNKIGSGAVRTLPDDSSKLTFFVIGDYGNGSRRQYELAQVMTREVEKRRQSDSPVRFVLTTGDNIYGNWFFGYRRTGNKDSHWEGRFFEPYESIIRHIPFYPTLGNHDGNSSESQGDLTTYLDNFFFPGGEPSRYYDFSFAGLADFFALDSTINTDSGSTRPTYSPESEQYEWLKSKLAQSQARWKIAYFHHPLFAAGPRHVPSMDKLRHIHELFVKQGVQVVFNGHEHNLQIAERNDRSGGVQYIISGSGGALRAGKVSTSDMRAANIAGWAPEVQFLIVEIEGSTMTVTPKGLEPITVTGPDGKPVEMPLALKLGGEMETSQ